MKAFIYNGNLYIRCIPAKTLFRSTTIHNIVNRGDIFAIRVIDSCLTVIPGDAEVEHLELKVPMVMPSLSEVRAQLARKAEADQQICDRANFASRRYL